MARINGTTGDDYTNGTSNADAIYGFGGNDQLFGLAGNDQLFGGDGNDVLDGGLGDDTLDGGAGSDTILPDISGFDTVDGGSGIDMIDLSRFDIGAEIDVRGGGGVGVTYGRGGNAPTVMYAEAVESFVGTNFADAINLYSVDYDVTVSAGDGDDFIRGGRGSNTLAGGQGDDHIDVIGVGGVADGGIGNDQIFSDFVESRLSGGIGDDLLWIGDMTSSARVVTIDLANQILSSGLIDIVVEGFESVMYGGSNVIFIGSEGSETFTYNSSYSRMSVAADGGAGEDVINAADGDDRLTGGSGADRIIAFGGSDEIDGGAGADVLWGGEGDDDLRGGADADTLTGGAGMNQIDGGEGFDTVSYAGSPGAVIVDLRTGIADVAGWSSDHLVGIEGVVGSDDPDQLTGNGDDNRLDGGAGADRLVGGGGADTYVVDDPGDRIFERSEGGRDTVIAAISYTLSDNIEDLVLGGVDGIDGKGNQLANVIIGNEGANLLKGAGGDDVLSGASGNDTLSGGAGADAMAGGAGNDQYSVDNVGDVVSESADGGYDMVKSTIDYVLGDEVEKLILGNLGRSGTGNPLDNLLVGGRGNDTLSGMDGADTLDGGMGRDKLAGGAGADRFVFRDGDTGATAAEADRILDFSHADDDKIVLRAIDAIAGGLDDPFKFIGTSSFTGTAGELRYVFAGGDTLVQGDVNGDGVSDLVIRLVGQVTLVTGDFSL